MILGGIQMQLRLMENNNVAVFMNIEPSQIRGSRSAFGALLHIGFNFQNDSPRRPMMFEGSLRWASESAGLTIPLQAIANTYELVAPISDHQVAELEATRGANEPIFSLDLRAVDADAAQGHRIYRISAPMAIRVSRDDWERTLKGFGNPGFRIVELPLPPVARSSDWKRASDLLAAATQHVSSGRYGEAVATTRSALERIVEAVGAEGGAPRDNAKEKRLGSYIERLTTHFTASAPSDSLRLVMNLIKTANGWCSEPVHQGFHVSQRDDAIFAINLCVSLYSFLLTTPPMLAVSNAAPGT